MFTSCNLWTMLMNSVIVDKILLDIYNQLNDKQ